MENNQMNTTNANPMIKFDGLDTELQKAAINQLPGLYELGKQGLTEAQKVAESTIQATESMYQTASGATQERVKIAVDLLKDPNLPQEERAKVWEQYEKEAEHARKLDETMPKQVQEAQKDFNSTIIKIGCIAGGITLLLGAPAAAYGAYKLYQTYKAS